MFKSLGAIIIFVYFLILVSENMDKFEPPSSMYFDGNVAENCDVWKQELELYLVATEKDGKSDKIKTSILLHCIGKQGREIYNTFTWTTDDDRLRFEAVLEKFDNYCQPRKNLTYLRHRFFSYRQRHGEFFDDFVTELKKRSAPCEFGTIKESLIKDIIVYGTSDNRLRERLLREHDLTLVKAVEIGHAAEETLKHAKELEKAANLSTASVSYVKNKSKSKPEKKKSVSTDNNLIASCLFCGESQARGQCKAWGKTCKRCGRPNHFSKVCKSKSKSKEKSKTQNKSKKVHHVVESDSSSEESDTDFFVGSVQSELGLMPEDEPFTGSDDNSQLGDLNNFKVFSLESELENNSNDWVVDLETNGRNVQYKLDTSSQVNVLPKSVYFKLLEKPKLHSTKVKLSAYNDSPIPVIGRCVTDIKHRKKPFPVMFVVADTEPCPIIGLNTCERLNFIKRIMTVNSGYSGLIDEFSDVFGKIGCLGKEHHTEVDPNVTPSVNPPTKIPIALMGKLKNELNRMEKLSIIEKVSHPTDWVNNIVIVEKSSGSIRVCLDPKQLNKAIKRHYYQMPTPEEIFRKWLGQNILLN